MQITTWPVDAHTRLTGILGYPVGHSFSPLLHNAAYFAQGLNYRYVALPVPPQSLASAVRGLGALGFAGANVTIPHKEAVLPLLDAVSARAKAVGAVNTIVCRHACTKIMLHGDNTDVTGFLAPLQPFQEALRGASVVILGAGGAARAAVYGLLSGCEPSRITLAARTPGRAARLCEDLADSDSRGILSVVPLSGAGPRLRAATLIVNATPVGMHPAVQETPWHHASDFHGEHIVYDLVYRPQRTQLLRDAAARGARTVDGIAMLLHQAAAAYRQWTNRPMPLAVARSALPSEYCSI